MIFKYFFDATIKIRKMNGKTIMNLFKKRSTIFLISIMILCFASCSHEDNSISDNTERIKKDENISSDISKKETSGNNSTVDLNLPKSCFDNKYYTDTELAGYFADTQLQYCSFIDEDENGDTILTWNLKSTGEEIFRCMYKYDNHKGTFICYKSEGFDNYLNGDTDLIRYFPLFEKGDDIWANEPESYRLISFFQRYCILGECSDLKSYTDGDDIYIDYYWYQNTSDGPVLVYEVSAKNQMVISSTKYHDELWQEFDKSYKNINIIKYDEYQRTTDYSDVIHQWNIEQSLKTIEDNTQELIDEYCACADEDDLFYSYYEEFDDISEAEEFWESYCE